MAKPAFVARMEASVCRVQIIEMGRPIFGRPFFYYLFLENLDILLRYLFRVSRLHAARGEMPDGGAGEGDERQSAGVRHAPDLVLASLVKGYVEGEARDALRDGWFSHHPVD